MQEEMNWTDDELYEVDTQPEFSSYHSASTGAISLDQINLIFKEVFGQGIQAQLNTFSTSYQFLRGQQWLRA